MYLADFSRQVLFPLAGGVAAEEVAGTMAGRAFATGQPVSAERDGSVRVWVPVAEQTTRTGVLALTVPQAGPEILAQAELLGALAGLTAAVATRLSDVPDLRRRERVMSPPASMQWDLLPPLSARAGGAVIAGMLEPAYDIAGDAFDYVVNGGDLHFAIIDGMGHGIGSTLPGPARDLLEREAASGQPADNGRRSGALVRSEALDPNGPGITGPRPLRSLAHIQRLPSGSFQVKVYAGTEPVTGKARPAQADLPRRGLRPCGARPAAGRGRRRPVPRSGRAASHACHGARQSTSPAPGSADVRYPPY